MKKDKMGRLCGMNEEEEMRTGFWWGKARERDHLENTGVDERVVIKWILRKSVEKTWIGLIWLRLGTVGEICPRGN